MKRTDGYALVLGRDLTEDGQALGRGTIIRLEKALHHAGTTGETLVVSATYSPWRQHADQPCSMARMMAKWLSQQGYNDTVVMRAPTFNTRGELIPALQLDHLSTIIGENQQLRRVYVLVEKMCGTNVAHRLTYVPADEVLETGRAKSLEVWKLRFVKYVPFFMQESIRLVVVWIFNKRGKNLSY